MSAQHSGVHVARSGTALIATIDRPQSKNALSRAAALALEEFAHAASADSSVRVGIITGAGRDVFASGGDLREFDELAQAGQGAEQVLAMGSTMHALERCEVPIIAAVQGKAFGGGCELALACDLVIVEPHATMTFRQASMGLSTGWGGGTRLLERVGAMHASRLLLLGDTIEPEQALRLGLVCEVAADGQSLARAQELGDKISRYPRNVIAAIKRMLLEVRRELRGQSFTREAEVFASLWNGPDHREAMDAFFRRCR